jgi:hypothetical protein
VIAVPAQRPAQTPTSSTFRRLQLPLRRGRDRRRRHGSGARPWAPRSALNTITTLDDDAGPASGLRGRPLLDDWNLRVNTIKIGAEDVSVFAGLGTGPAAPEFETDDGTADPPSSSTDATGFFIGNLDFGPS